MELYDFTGNVKTGTSHFLHPELYNLTFLFLTKQMQSAPFTNHVLNETLLAKPLPTPSVGFFSLAYENEDIKPSKFIQEFEQSKNSCPFQVLQPSSHSTSKTPWLSHHQEPETIMVTSLLGYIC